jgi:carbon-monoxide dehydrogenase medium subunit
VEKGQSDKVRQWQGRKVEKRPNNYPKIATLRHCNFAALQKESKMPKRPTSYHRPDNLNEALHLLAQSDRIPLAGGTKLLAGDVDGAVVDLQALGLNRINWIDGRLVAGAMVTLANLVVALTENEHREGPTDLLQKAVQQAGPNTYRQAATLGGTIASRLPDSELLAALLVLDAQISFAGTEEPSMMLVDYLAAQERPSGLITAITIPWETGDGHSERVARTPADYPIVSITCWQPQDGGPRLAATGIGERPFRLHEAESFLAAGLTEANIKAAEAAAKAAANHPGDFRGTASYRAEMASVLTRRVCRYSV